MNTSPQHIYHFIINSTIDEAQTRIKDINVGNYEGVILQIDTQDFPAHNIPLLIELFAQKQLVIIGVRTENTEVLEFAKFSNIAIFSTKPTKVIQDNTQCYPQKAPSIIRGNIGSNEQVYAKDCDLVVTQDVHDSADAMSDKNISIYGGGYGKAFAGINDENAFIFVAYFQLKLVCINGVYKKFEKIPKELLNKSVVIILENGALKFTHL